jgi:hypothetical protein
MSTEPEVPTQQDAAGNEVPVPELPQPEERAVRGRDGVPVGTWGQQDAAVPGDPGWWGSANGDVQTFHSEDDAKTWVTEQLL